MSAAPQAPRSRYESIELHMPEVEKFIAGLEAGVFEAYQTLGMALGSIVDQPNQSDIFMAIIFGLMPESAQRTMLADPRIQESWTVLPLLQRLLASRDAKRHLAVRRSD